MNSNRTLARRYVAPLLGALLFSASVGGVVIGGYAAVQEDLGLCGTPTILVTSPSELDRPTVNGRHAPSVPKLDYEELTPAERRAYDEALADTLNEGEVRGEFAHESAFTTGAVLPTSAAGLLVGLLLFAGPFLVRRWRD